MALIWRCSTRIIRPSLLYRVMSSDGGGGSSGAVRDAGGAFGKRGSAEEERYFRKAEADLLAKIKEEHHKSCSYHDEEIGFHEDAIKKHRESIARHRLQKQRLSSDMRRQEVVK